MNESLLIIKQSLPLLLKGAGVTVQLFFTAVTISLTCGILCGFLRSKKHSLLGLLYVLNIITFILRGIPFYVQLLMAYFVIPDLLSIQITPFSAATVALGLCSAAYTSQIIKGGVESLSMGQVEAAQILGYSWWQVRLYIILPQVVRNVLPSLIGECDQLLKSTAIISTLGVLELAGIAKNIIAREMNPLSMYTIVAIMYLIMSSLFTTCAIFFKRKYYNW